MNSPTILYYYAPILCDNNVNNPTFIALVTHSINNPKIVEPSPNPPTIAFEPLMMKSSS